MEEVTVVPLELSLAVVMAPRKQYAGAGNLPDPTIHTPYVGEGLD